MSEQIDIPGYMKELGQRARAAGREIARATSDAKDHALRTMAEAIRGASAELQAANQRDLAAGREKGLEQALLDRLTLTDARIEGMAVGLEQIASLPDPVGEISDLRYVPSGIQVGRMRVPLGVVGIIYESRPNVTADAAGLCIKSGNAAILRGGSEAIHSNQAIAACIRRGLTSAGVPEEAVQVVATTDRAAVGELLTLAEFVDVIVPRGGKGLIERISRESQIPVIKHLDGVCHVFLDDEADREKALAIAVNAKTQRFGTCNTMETLLVAQSRAAELLPSLVEPFKAAEVELRGCPRSREILAAVDGCECAEASEADWYAEYLAPILAIRVVADLDAAIDHIERYGSHHTDSIVTESFTKARRFLREVDSSSVMINASTRLADGFEYGLGAEIGISTDKLHARGPVGLEGLTNQKFVVIGDGHLRR